MLEGNYSYAVAQLLRTRRPDELREILLNRDIRRTLMQGLLTFYALHVSEFGEMRTLPVLQAILSS